MSAWTTTSFEASIAKETAQHDYDDEWVSYRLPNLTASLFFL